MHSKQIIHKGEEVNFHFDSGLTGDLIIIDKNNNKVRIPAQTIVKLVAYEYILPQKINQLEQMTAEELLK